MLSPSNMKSSSTEPSQQTEIVRVKNEFLFYELYRAEGVHHLKCTDSGKCNTYGCRDQGSFSLDHLGSHEGQSSRIATLTSSESAAALCISDAF